MCVADGAIDARQATVAWRTTGGDEGCGKPHAARGAIAAL